MSEHKPTYPHLFPIAYGNEEETMMMAGGVGDDYIGYTEPEAFATTFERYIPNDLKSAYEGDKRFLQGGNLVYDGGAVGSANLERATPECSTPSEFAAAVQANERLLVNMTSNYVQESQSKNTPIAMRLQRRVVDNYGHTRASHDNFEVRNSYWLENFGESNSEKLLLAHLATRSFITGAGYVTPNGLRFGQKIEHAQSLTTYGYENSVYRTPADIDTGHRLEIRCSDINISPWALKVRIGTSALLLTMLQTPLGQALQENLPGACHDRELYLDNLRRFNKAPMNNDGQLLPSKNLYRALDFQQSMYDLMADALGDYVELSDEYQHIIQEAQYYCDDFRKVLGGEAELELLKDRSDIGVKFSKIAASVRRGRNEGSIRTPNDIISQYWDMKYDLIEVAPGNNQAQVTYGYGYRYRDRNGFKDSVSPSAVDQAYYNPPKTTRAFIRGSLIKTGDVHECSWSSVRIHVYDGELSDINGASVRLPQVVVSGLSKAADARKYVRSAFYSSSKQQLFS